MFGPTSSQEDVYRSTTEPLVDGLWMGRNGLLFAYGVTNAGKTYTIMGTEDNPGLLPRALEDVFDRMGRDEKTMVLACRLVGRSPPSQLFLSKVQDLQPSSIVLCGVLHCGTAIIDRVR